MSQPITNLSVGSFIKIPETVDGETASRPWIIIATGNGNPYGSDKVFCLRKSCPFDKMIFGSSTYENSTLDTFFSSTYQQRFSQVLLSCVATSTVICNDVVSGQSYTIGRKFFAPSVREVGHTKGEDSSIDPLFFSYNTPANRAAFDDGNNQAGYWLRVNETTTTAFYVDYYYSATLNDKGRSVNPFSTTNGNGQGVRPACNIFATTLVSDEPDEDGYYALIPDPTDPYLYVRFSCYMGAVANKPLNIRVDLTTEGNPEIYELQVCNNYKDTAPTWETMTEGKKHAFTNTEKETENWEIGVRVVARGENTIRVYEPFVIVQTEQEKEQ